MLTLEQMLIRLGLAALLGLIMGLERQFAGKEAGLRTDMMVAAGAAIFSIAGMSLPYLVAFSPERLTDIIARNSGFFAVIANVIVGVGFLGAGIIVKQGVHVHGLTTAATVWFVAAVGVLCGIGLLELAVVAALGMSAILWLSRLPGINKFMDKEMRKEE